MLTEEAEVTTGLKQEYDLAPLERKSSMPPMVRAAIISEAPMRRTEVRPTPPILSYFAILFFGCSLMAMSFYRGLLIGEIAAVAMTPLALFGCARGAIRKIVMLAAMFGALYAGAMLPTAIQPYVASFTGTAASVTSMLISGVIVIVGLFVARLIGKALRRRVASVRGINLLDRMGGAIIGAGEGALIVMTLAWVCTMVRPHVQRVHDQSAGALGSFQSNVIGNVLRISDESSGGSFGEFVRSTNPIEKVPALRDAIAQLNATGQLKLPALDPQLMEQAKKLLESDKTIDKPDINSLLESYKKSMQAHDPAYKQLPKSSN